MIACWCSCAFLTLVYASLAGLFCSGAALAKLGKFYAAAIVSNQPPLDFDVVFGPAYKVWHNVPMMLLILVQDKVPMISIQYKVPMVL